MADEAGYALSLSPAELERYALMAELARATEADLWQAAGITAGASVADIGCGPGAMFPALVSSVGPTGRVVGVDGDRSAVGSAQALVAASGWANVTVQEGRADATGLRAESFDCVLMRHVLSHNKPLEQAIVEHLATLVRPGGYVYLVDADGSGMRLRPSDPDVDSLLDAYLRFHVSRGNDFQAGLRLDTLLVGAGLELVAYRGWYNIVRPRGSVRPPAWAAREAMRAAGMASAEDIERWDAALTRLAEQRPTLFAPLFGAVGRRPAG